MSRYRVAKQHMKMIDSQIKARGIKDPLVIQAMEKVPRHIFVEEALLDQAYADSPLPIGERQTISQPYIVALMTEALGMKGNERILEIGTGCGYQTAVLAEIAEQVFSVERFATLALKARRTLDSLNYFNVITRVGDGTYGWSEEAPFDGIIVTAGAPTVPAAYKKQLAVGGRLVIPIGDSFSQTMMKYTRLSEDPEDVQEEDFGGCRFVRLVGEYGWKG